MLRWRVDGFVFLAVSASAPGDIVLIRPGTYNELVTLSSPVTLRATRAGPVRIGQ